jgi:hypothetical protein
MVESSVPPDSVLVRKVPQHFYIRSRCDCNCTPIFMCKEIRALTPKFATPHQSHVNCKEAADGAAVDFPLPNSENSVC